MRLATKLRSTAVLSALFVWAMPAAAAGNDAAAEALFVQAREAMSHGDYARACPMLEESYRLVPGVGTRFNLGDCYENVGKTASAWAVFRDVAAASRLAGQMDREATARARAGALENKLCRAAIRVAPQTDVAITRDGELVGPGQWGILLPVDPGIHTIEAKAAGKMPWSSTFTVKDCPANASVDVPVLSSNSNVVSPRAQAPEPHETPEPPRSAGVRTAAMLGSFGLGAVAVGVGSYLGLHARSLRDESNDGHCIGNRCDDVGSALRDDSIHAGTGATIAFAAGAVFLAVGTFLWLSNPAPKPTKTARTP